MTLVYFLLAITFLVFVHELGHFLAARSCGVRVLSFSIGFGPALASVQWRGTEYRLAMIPLGGYVKMLGESSEQHADPTESFAAQSPLRRAWISLAGPLANLVLAWLLFAALVWQQP
ncbi:MAG: RIP metalloprotease, partial [Betaproteobacteria bacterium]|nr:RIP metalloprotease [Betaproteobacteria bacterium]